MTQNGVVTQKLSDGKVEVSILRGTACGGSCGSCEACVYNSRILIQADNPIHASVGDRVIVHSSTAGIMAATLLVYMLPLVFFFVCYILASVFGAGQTTSIILSFAGLSFGVLVMILIGRKKQEVRYELAAYLR